MSARSISTLGSGQPRPKSSRETRKGTTQKWTWSETMFLICPLRASTRHSSWVYSLGLRELGNGKRQVTRIDNYISETDSETFKALVVVLRRGFASSISCKRPWLRLRRSKSAPPPLRKDSAKSSATSNSKVHMSAVRLQGDSP
jgi:hypothetical protein